MADKNLHDIKIDDLDSPKKTPLKNILTLLALLFIILVISVAITRLILNTDEEGSTENNNSINSAIVETDNTQEDDNGIAKNAAGLAAVAAAGTMLANGTSLTERNVSANTKNASSTATKKDDDSSKEKDHGSKIKVPLRVHQTIKPKEVTAPKKHTPVPKKPKTVVKKAPTNSGKQYIDKVVSSSKKSSSSHSHLGEKRPGYYIKVGTFKDTSTAVNKIKKTGLDYILIKPKNDKTMTRVLIGPFKSNWGAKQHLPSVKNNIAEGAYITRID